MGDMATLVANTGSVVGALERMVYVICYLIGLIFGISSLIQAAKTAQRGGNSNGGYGGAIGSFAIGAILLATPSALTAGSESIYGAGHTSAFSYNPPLANSLSAQGLRMVQTILAWCQLFGIIAFVKGLMMVRATANGTGAQTYGPGITFIVGGAMASNIVLLINAVATTFGMPNVVSGG